ncbi:MAG: [FeFe] hydrogenase H-cluster radical SAM maturase HydG, partial [Ignavibacteriales bacterium]|nr:[FeFe] hydrogenase H-cluster radical SAM maturase HydG [Ignavibacteriales bacterium]
RVYSIDENGNNIRRANINIAPLDLEGFRRLKTFKIGTYQIFQETYHYDTYKTMHPSGPKADYSFRLDAPTRAIEAGIDDVGIGALFGLTDYRFETLAMLRHAEFLDREVGVGPHTISIPRLEPADHAPAAMRPPDAVSDHDFKKLVAALRLAVPYTGIILSTREKPELRRQVFELGVSQISAGSRTSPGSYKESKESLDHHELAQFQLGDHRPADEVIRDCCSLGYLPSFCTACYRLGRTGDRFMELAKSGAIGKICGPNALITFKEYLIDYGSEETKREGEAFIQKELAKQPDATRRKIEEAMAKLEAGEHDVFM